MRRLSVCLILLIVFVSQSAAQPRDASTSPRFTLERVRAELGLDEKLSPEKGKAFADALAALIKGDHPVRNRLDVIFDVNNDKRIDQAETRAAREFFFGPALVRLSELDPEAMKPLFDGPARKLTREDLSKITVFMFDPAMGRPHPSKSSIDRRFDKNGNGTVDGNEIEEGRRTIFSMAVAAVLAGPVRTRPALRPGPARTLFDELADANGDGTVDEFEVKQAAESLAGPHPVRNAFDKRVDFNRNGTIESFEIEKAYRASAIPSEKGTGDRFAKEPYPVKTAIDELFDIDGDGKVLEREIGAVLRGAVEGKVSNDVKKLAEFMGLKEGTAIERKQLMRILEILFRPHPVSPRSKTDGPLDRNGNGFIEPDEIGLAAGVSSNGPVPSIDARLDRARTGGALSVSPVVVDSKAKTVPAAGQQPDAAEKGGVTAESTAAADKTSAALPQLTLNISGKKIAVVSISDASKAVSESDLEGLYLFIQNAFINVGKATIVERKELGEVLQEVELSLSVGDEAAVAKAGKMSGADVLAIGSLSKVGSKYYLNVRLIFVTTGELMGSSVTTGESADNFFDMGTEAVVKLF